MSDEEIRLKIFRMLWNNPSKDCVDLLAVMHKADGIFSWVKGKKSSEIYTEPTELSPPTGA